MKKIILTLLLSLFVIMALAAPVYAEDDEDEMDEDGEEENEALSADASPNSGEKSTPGFGLAFAVAGALAAARLFRARVI
jgi:PGF-CTERM protein